MQKVELIIVGAGAAGLMCAITAAKRGINTMILEKAKKPGRKILMSGGGRCNFTNLNVSPDNYLSHNPYFCRSALSRYQPSDFITLVEKHHIAYHEKTLGQLFCNDKSHHILNMLLHECQQAGVNIQLNTNIQSVAKRSDETWILKTTNTHYISQALVIATGGLSIPSMGASPFGYRIAEQFNIPVWPVRAGLVPFTLNETDKARFSSLSGISQPIQVTACSKTSFEEAMLFTHRGLSGPAMLQISSYWQTNEAIEINLLPKQDILHYLKKIKSEQPKLLVKTALAPFLPKRLIPIFLDELSERPLQLLSYINLQNITQKLTQFSITPNGTEGYRTAEVTLGGIDCNALSSKTFEAKDVSGLYFIGEVVDVTGWLGGYNFQWAWASGHACGQSILQT